MAILNRGSHFFSLTSHKFINRKAVKKNQKVLGWIHTLRLWGSSVSRSWELQWIAAVLRVINIISKVCPNRNLYSTSLQTPLGPRLTVYNVSPEDRNTGAESDMIMEGLTALQSALIIVQEWLNCQDHSFLQFRPLVQEDIYQSQLSSSGWSASVPCMLLSYTCT